MTALAALFLALAVQPTPGSEVVRDWLVIPPTDRTGRRPFAPSVVFEHHLLSPDAAAPKVGDALKGELGEEKSWSEQKAGDDGSLGGEVGWAYARVESAERRVVLAKLSGAGRLFVNGAGFPGDLYAYGFGGVPVALRKGANDVYVGGVRGSFRLELVDVATQILAGSWDHVVPDVVRGDTSRAPSLGFLVWNTSEAAHDTTVTGYFGITQTAFNPYQDMVTIPPGSAWRFSLPVDLEKAVAGQGETAPVQLTVETGSTILRERVEIPVRGFEEARRVSFTSAIDGSPQTYALVPPKDRRATSTRKVLLSLHGASVDALSQARAYAQKPDIAILCPTNRRPYGFDWQDWGRLDAYEALDQFLGAVESNFDRYERRRAAHIVLTGHSMGGHGTWNLAANDADAFDAIGPSAGWASFDSYGGRPDGTLKELWQGADFASRTEELAANLVALPTFVLHGTADDNVPPSEAHDMIARLEKLGGKPKSHFQEGAGHWWDGDLSPGADCVDHPSILALFDEKPQVDEYVFDWIGADPGVDSHHRWIEVLQPLTYGRPFRVVAQRGEDRRTIQVETENVRAIRFARVTGQLRAALDGKSLGAWPGDSTWALTAQGWTRVEDGKLTGKSPARCGPFKRAFDNRFVLVHGTSGDANEDRELFERARYDQITWWYRANGTPPLLSDEQFLKGDYAGRNVILYGNRDTNAAWKKLLPESGPIDARRGELRLGARTWKGDDLGAVLVRPRADDAVGLVGAFADTGVRGTRLGYVLAPFTSGVGYPDYAVWSSAILGSGDGGVLAAGWFGADWNLDPKQFAQPEAR
ncbi:MAG: prolyl oligopeptidase family serine peptidase [Planctomycetota bacterium]|nr:prolyl oligopeptidase family serine peptidase [Planctomycetota bacterium]